MAGRVIALILVISLTAFLAACGGRSSSTAGVVPTTNTPTGTPAPSMEELEAKLWAELDRLGIDPERAVAAAPSGATNGVFDLNATVIDPDGAGEEPPTGVELTWTERLLGNYDMNGQVNVSDLTPIGQRWDSVVSYDDPGSHDGIGYWPDGDPEVDAGNWRLARVDGNSNGLIEAADITTIGQHWMEVLTGYRVYRKAPGSDEFVRLANPESSVSMLTIPRPEGIDQSGPVRYTFTDTPPGMGEYEYYVIGWSELTGHSSSEAETESNHVTARMSVSLTDTTPPTWDDTVGITAAVDNTDGTVTVEWGTATDIAVPPAPATPPVTYTVYYSTETPINFDNAGTVKGLTATTWTSEKMVAGQEYHFAVRCRDSVDQPNEDLNTAELSVTVTDMYPLHDWDPPVWTEEYTYTRPGESETEYTVIGIRNMEVGDGVIHITCGEAIDELSPPVHYDLYYLDMSRISGTVQYPAAHEDVQIIQDIPMDYDFVWPNRKGVALCVRARDSAESPNLTTNRWGVETAPTSLSRIPIDMNLPGLDQIDPAEFLDVWGSSETDRNTKTRYIYYYFKMQGNVEPAGTLWVLALDLETGEWTTDLEMSFDGGQPEIYYANQFEINQIGEVWFRVDVTNGGVTYEQFYYRAGPGDWRLWDPPDIQGYWDGDFDFNNRPVFYEYLDSDVTPGKQYKLHYRWWDEENQLWHSEFVCDPAGTMTNSTVRPDGVVQLSTNDDYLENNIPVDLYGHLLERSPDGTWIEILLELGKIGGCVTDAYWGEEWAWCGSIRDNPLQPGLSDKRLLIYGNAGYSFIDADDFIYPESGRFCWPDWPAENGAYHSPPEMIYYDNSLRQCSYSFTERSCNELYSGITSYIFPRGFNGYSYDKSSGWYAITGRCLDIITGSIQVYLYTSTGGDRIYDLDW